MQSLYRYTAAPTQCGYLPAEQWSLEYELVAGITADQYEARLLAGWRRFGNMLFRPQCAACRACRSLRVDVARFAPNRSQRRAWRDNADLVLRIGVPSVTRSKLALYDRFHAFQSNFKDWPIHPEKDIASYRESFVRNPAFTEEWCYTLDGRLVGVGYVDDLPTGLSAIYFFSDPDHRGRSLGTFNVLKVIEAAKERGRPFVYLGFCVAGCRSLAYKANFRPHQILHPDGTWRPE